MGDPDATHRPAGLFRRLSANAIGLARAHIGLFGVELEEARAQSIKVLVLVLFGIGAILLFLLTATLAAVLLVDPAWRVTVVCALSALYLLAALGCLLGARRTLARGEPLFGATLEELRRDQERLLP